MRTALRHHTRYLLGADTLCADGPAGGIVEWRRLDRLKLSYFSTKRDRSDGWMQLSVGSTGGRTVKIDSSLDGFHDVVERAAHAAGETGLTLSETTRANLKAMGISVAMDDFGTGYSSLSNLRAFPFDKIKIDQRFVRDIETSTENQAIVRAIISLARDLKMRITAEGVENEQQAAVLAGMGCTEVQGFLYSRPVPASELAKKEALTRAGSNVLQLRRRA